ncbi:carbohydrate ABC transporter permease [Diaminobutyricibacter tongyongensis]|uniref:Carbohydrate ABC transporter permease n=1 Tax=Leifsonia tongyongensis TaxID=1268043 RepID=A0A6L9XUK0_9MICO|nr:carbohydrate ABC transporter permease [Diaminobutyricibacter tongyongensis]NEN04976.1 carbohydrate ABC transporter permease [Diaminobutyricibacter tongyongensis]
MTTQTAIGIRRPQAIAGVRRRQPKGWWRTAAIALIALVINLPLLNAIYTSLKTDAAIGISPFSVVGGFNLDHYATVLSGSRYNFPAYLLNSAQLSIGTVILVLIIAIPASYAIVRTGFGGRWLLEAITSLRLVPAMFFAVPFFLIFTGLGIYDTVFGLVLADTFVQLPLALLIICGSLRDIPIEIEEASSIDGAGTYRTMFSVVLPLLAPALVAVGIIVFVFAWSDYLFAVILSASGAVPVTVGAAFFVTSAGIQWGNLAAVTVISVIIPLCFAFIAQRYLVRGLSAGAIK